MRLDKRRARKRRHLRVRKKVSGTSERPRLCVFRSARHIYGQLIDDTCGRVLVAASSLEREIRDREITDPTPHRKVAIAREVGRLLGERAKAAGIDAVVFDRAGYKYHGRVAALADGAREAGLRF